MISDELREHYEAAVRADIPRSVLVEVSEAFPLAAMQARASVAESAKAIDGGFALTKLREARAAGLLRHQVTDQAFEQILLQNEAELISRVPVDRGPTDARDAPVFLTTGKFGGTLLGFASHREANDLPIKNATRLALCSQNRGLVGDLFTPLEAFSARPRSVLIPVQRDPFDIGKIGSISISLIDPKVEGFLFQRKLNDFLSSYGERSVSGRKIELKADARRFRDKSGRDRASGA